MTSYAYDFSRFEEKEERYDRETNAARELTPRRKERPLERPDTRDKVIEIPREELEKSRRIKLNPFKVFIRSFFFLAIFGSVVALVFTQVQLTELTEQINVETKALSEAKALEVQLEMQTAEKVNSAEVEDYARRQLGMSKISENQVVYMNLATDDQGTVLESQDSGNIFTNIAKKVKSIFA